MSYIAFMDIVKFFQALYPCLVQNYPTLVSGATQVVGGASILYLAGAKYMPATLKARLPELGTLMNALALNPKSGA